MQACKRDAVEECPSCQRQQEQSLRMPRYGHDKQQTVAAVASRAYRAYRTRTWRSRCHPVGYQSTSRMKKGVHLATLRYNHLSHLLHQTSATPLLSPTSTGCPSVFAAGPMSRCERGCTACMLACRLTGWMDPADVQPSLLHPADGPPASPHRTAPHRSPLSLAMSSRYHFASRRTRRVRKIAMT